jgi:hypothetical protein
LADNIRHGHPGVTQYRLDVLDRRCDLRLHVAGMLGCAVPVDRGLASAEQDTGRAIHELTLVEPELQGPRPRLIVVRSTIVLLVVYRSPG